LREALSRKHTSIGQEKKDMYPRNTWMCAVKGAGKGHKASSCFQGQICVCSSDFEKIEFILMLLLCQLKKISRVSKEGVSDSGRKHELCDETNLDPSLVRHPVTKRCWASDSFKHQLPLLLKWDLTKTKKSTSKGYYQERLEGT
jgi:hypothetical protein